jgi:predicted  nucleic acid-binding Zn-ribbon protein
MTTTQSKFDASKTFYAWVGAAELAVEKLRESAADVQERDLKAFAAQVGTQFSKSLDDLVGELQKDLESLPQSAQARLEKLPEELKALPRRIEALVEDARDLPKSAQARFEELQGEAKTFRGRFDTIVEAHRSTFADFAEEYVEAFEELAVRGRAFVAKLRDDSISGDVEIIDPDAEVVKDVSPAVEKAAAEAAAKATGPNKPIA